MRALERQVNTSYFVPDFLARSVLDVDFKELREQGVRFIAFDADSTLVHFRARSLSQETQAFLRAQRKLFEDWCIASNRLTNDLVDLGSSMDAQVIRATLLTRKPSRRFFKRIIDHFGCRPEEIAMVGDKLFADMWGAKRAGLTTVWVEKIGPDSPWDTVLRTRYWEKQMLKRYTKQ